LRRLEDKKDDLVWRRIRIVGGDGLVGVSEIVAIVQRLGSVISEIEYERRLEDEKKRRTSIVFSVQLPRTAELGKMVDTLEAIPGVRRVYIQRVP
jgi:putative Mg2+ transporter-C (MgtC) family protein